MRRLYFTRKTLRGKAVVGMSPIPSLLLCCAQFGGVAAAATVAVMMLNLHISDCCLLHAPQLGVGLGERLKDALILCISVS